MDEDTRTIIEANQNNLARVIGFVGIMDSKATFVFTLVLALTAYLVAQLTSFLNAQHQTPTPWAAVFFVLLDIAAIACLACFVATALLVINTLRPRTTQHTQKTSPLFFGTIATMPCETFKEQMKALSANQYIDLLIDQTYDNAKVIAQKTLHVKRSINVFYWGLVCFFIFTIGRPILMSLTGH